MGLSREARIITLLVIDTVFFFVEIIIGYWVGSLALVADSFHMLNDIISLIVALYAIKLATSPSTATNSYGWQRAEILGALINGVFLVALCVSIMLEAIKRFFSVEEVQNPMLVVIVGCLGLASNVVGLFLFHEHGHSHGGHSHSHDEESHSHSHPTPPAIITTRPPDDETTSLLRNTSTAPIGTSPSHARNESFSSLYGHPAQTRAAVIETAAEFGYGRDVMSPPASSSSSNGRRIALPKEPEDAHTRDHAHGAEGSSNAHPHSHSHGAPSKADEKPEDHGHGHSHGNMNMRGVFLHVLGDALGNVGVIAAGLVIWFVKARWALYFDPAVSLFITVIIFTSALPLVKSASYILLQGVPSHVSLEAVHKSITAVDGVVSVHELHVWQLSEKTVVASVHVLVATGHDYMPVANGIREVMHHHGIHSVTIQPENVNPNQIPAEEAADQACLIRCPPELCAADTCCPPANGKLVDVEEADETSHTH